MRKVLFAIFSLLLPWWVMAQAPSPARIQQRLQREVETNHLAPGIVVGIIDEHGSKVIAYGNDGTAAGKPVNGDTLFEIGSITKLFTTLLLQDMVDRGEVKLDDPISKYLPATVKVPTRNGRVITLADLATHMSGLPKLPTNMDIKYLTEHAFNPYAEYGPEQLYDFLAHYALPRDIGTKYEYSNVGVGLLGHVLSLRAGTDYESLVVNRICKPLGMDSTRITLTPELITRLAPGYTASGVDVVGWDFQALAGCGALRSSVNDMLKYLAANMGLSNSVLNAAMARTHVPVHEADFGRKTGLAWVVNPDGIIWHNGGTGGYRSFMGFAPQTGRGVIVLADSANDVDALGLWILGPARTHQAAKIDTGVYDRYVGTYRFNPQLALTVTREGDRLRAQMTGQGPFEVYPESETEFFYKIVDAQLTFVKDGSGQITHLILHQNGMDQKAVKSKPSAQ